MRIATIECVSHEWWLGEGRRRFGEYFGNWKFVCPVCGNVARVDEFRPHQEQGARPNSATQHCIGRYQSGRSAFSGEGKGPCDYAAYGLLRLAPCRVLVDGKEAQCFAFAEPGGDGDDGND